MAARLISEEGDLKGLVLAFENGNQWIIGRDPDESQLVIHDPLVSRKHALAVLQPDGIYIQNLSETNPIQINDEELRDTYLLHHGDSLKIGNELFRYYTDSDAHVLDEEYPSTIETYLQDSLPPENVNDTQEPLIQEDSDKTMDKTFDTILNDDDDDFANLAEIDFGLSETGRWMIKVVGGPNNGAEFYMETGRSYILGTDPKSCDIVFHDNSVSRQHAKIIVSEEDALTIEDLNSRNGVLVSGKPVVGSESLQTNQIISLGTTSFIVYDREGEMQTIISPLLPSIVKILQGEEEKSVVKEEKEVEPFIPAAVEPAPIEEPLPPPPKHNSLSYALIALIIGLLTVVGIGTTALFKSEPVQTHETANADELIDQTLAPYKPSIKFAYNKATGGLLLIGHVATAAEKNQLLYTLHSLPFKMNIDDSGIVIDEGVWRETNFILSNNPEYKGISIHSPEPGHFVMTGTLKTSKQAEQLSNYIGSIFPYLDLLKREVVVEEEVLSKIQSWLHSAGLNNVAAQMNNGEISLTGNVPGDKADAIPGIIAKIKSIPGVRIVNNFTKIKTADMGIANITNQYQVTGSTKVGDKYTVIINGRILSEGDHLDGMRITSITSNAIFLEKESSKFKIDYKS
jgi:type III secretion system YscD/HrpQ family protein